MKFISPQTHGIIDYLVVVFLLASPACFAFTGLLATFTYALGIVHFLLTIFTQYSVGVVKVIPFTVHGTIEFIVGVALIILAYTLFKNEPTGMLFYAIFGTAVLFTWLFTNYKGVEA